MSKPFTNIAGGPFLPYVSKQIEARKKFLKESNKQRENKHLIYLNNKNSWIRLTSNTDVTQDHLLYKKYNLSGSLLAKKYVLQGGTVNNDNNKITNRAGVGENGLYNLLYDKPMGFKPIPGITSIDLSSAGKLGTLQYATINFICYDLEQLELMDALYMKLGFSLVLEWGHTIFINNEGILKNPKPLNVFNYQNKEDLLKDIQKNKIEHSGNYDAMLGTVSNFSWDVQSDGSYSCSITLVGAGDILESLKINQSIGSSDISNVNSNSPEDNLTSSIADKDLSLLNQSLFSIYQQVLKYKPIKNGVRVVGTNTDTYRNILNNIFSSCPYNFIQFDNIGNLTGDIKAIKGNHYSLISEVNKNKDFKIAGMNGFAVIGGIVIVSIIGYVIYKRVNK